MHNTLSTCNRYRYLWNVSLSSRLPRKTFHNKCWNIPLLNKNLVTRIVFKDLEPTLTRQPHKALTTSNTSVPQAHCHFPRYLVSLAQTGVSAVVVERCSLACSNWGNVPRQAPMSVFKVLPLACCWRSWDKAARGAWVWRGRAHEGGDGPLNVGSLERPLDSLWPLASLGMCF